MNQLSLTFRHERSFIKVARDLGSERIWVKIALWILAIDIFIFAAVILKIFYFQPTVQLAFASTIHISNEPAAIASDTVGPATNSLIDQLKMGGLSVTNVQLFKKSPFSGSGHMAVINGSNVGDNIQIFEYPDHDSAMKDASPLAARYMNSSRSSAWKQNMHLYVNSTLAIFYMGNQTDIVNSLDNSAVISLMEPAKSTSLLSKSTK